MSQRIPTHQELKEMERRALDDSIFYMLKENFDLARKFSRDASKVRDEIEATHRAGSTRW